MSKNAWLNITISVDMEISLTAGYTSISQPAIVPEICQQYRLASSEFINPL
jgi:hypothetical protein